MCVVCGAWCRWWDLYLDIKSSDPSWFIREYGSSSFCGGLRCPSNLSYPTPCHVTPVVGGHCHPSPWKQASPNTSHPTPLLHSGCLLRELLKIFSLLIIYTYWECSVLMYDMQEKIWSQQMEQMSRIERSKVTLHSLGEDIISSLPWVADTGKPRNMFSKRQISL